jgi:hypothetical protein
MRSAWAILSVLFLLSIAGCGGTSNDQACTDLATARCNKRNTCSNGARITRDYGDLPTCIAREKLSCLNSLAAKGTGNSAVAAENCSQAYMAQSCSDFFLNNVPAVCVYTGQLTDGQPCAFNGQCQSTYCINEKLTQCGVCGAAPSGSCQSTSCARGQECVTDNMVTPATMMCVTPGQVGDTCDRANPCAPDLSCTGRAATATRTCQPAVSTMGAACDPLTRTAPACDANLGLACNTVSKTCQPISYVGDGMPCGTMSDGSFAACAAGGECILPTAAAVMGTCKAPAADGAACDTQLGPPCLSPARCVTGGPGSSAGTCVSSDASQC